MKEELKAVRACSIAVLGIILFLFAIKLLIVPYILVPLVLFLFPGMG